MEQMDLNEARIYVCTYAKYNNGSLQGEWVTLSDFYDLEKFLEYCTEIHDDEEASEYMFQDWENIPDCLKMPTALYSLSNLPILEVMPTGRILRRNL